MILRTVTHRATAEAVTLLIAGEATTNGVATDVDLLAGLEGLHGDLGSQLKVVDAVDAVLAQVPQGLLSGAG